MSDIQVDPRPAVQPAAAQPAEDAGLTPNVAGALAYLLGPVTGVLFLLIGKTPFVRFHAAQSIGVSVAWIVVAVALSLLGAVLGAIPGIGWMIAALTGLVLWLAFGLGGFVLWLVLMYRAYQHQEWEVPVIGEQVRRMVPAA